MAHGLPWLDGLVAIGFGLNILWTGWGLVRESFSGLMDRADPALLGRIVEAAQAAREPGWIDLHQLRAWQAGDRVFVDFHLAVPSDWTVAQIHDANDRLHDILCDLLGDETELIVHFDPDRPDFDPSRPWTVETGTRIPASCPTGPAVPPRRWNDRSALVNVHGFSYLWILGRSRPPPASRTVPSPGARAHVAPRRIRRLQPRRYGRGRGSASRRTTGQEPLGREVEGRYVVMGQVASQHMKQLALQGRSSCSPATSSRPRSPSAPSPPAQRLIAPAGLFHSHRRMAVLVPSPLVGEG